jgi:transposase
MRKIKEVLRLSFLNAMSQRQIARGANTTKTTVHDYLLRASRAGITWLEAQHMNEDELERLLFPPPESGGEKKTLPDWKCIHQEMHHKHMTLQLLWEEYKEQRPDGIGYSRFCELYQRFTGTVEYSMRQTHKAGEKLFVDYSGTKMGVINRHTGELREAEIFVAVFGASNYTFVEATWTQQLPDWIGSHVRAFAFFDGVPELLVPDNLKSGITQASYYDPEINPTYQRFAEHYGVAVLPARPYRPKDKAKVEAGVQLAQRWIIAKLRNRSFFSLEELNEAIVPVLDQLNRKLFRKLPGSRETMFETVDKPVLRPLPRRPYEFDECKNAGVNIDYHISYDDHLYSVPYRLVRSKVLIRSTASMIEVFHKGTRVAVHRRSYRKYGRTTNSEHMPSAHRAYAEWTPERLTNWGQKSGVHVAALFDAIMKSRQHPEQGFRSCMGIMRMEKKVGRQRLDAACKRALELHTLNSRSVRTILEHKQESVPLETDEMQFSIHHVNVRGAAYYRQNGTEEAHAAASHD